VTSQGGADPAACASAAVYIGMGTHCLLCPSLLGAVDVGADGLGWGAGGNQAGCFVQDHVVSGVLVEKNLPRGLEINQSILSGLLALCYCSGYLIREVYFQNCPDLHD